MSFITPSLIDWGWGIVFNRFLCLYLCLFVSFFVSKITRKRLDRFAWNFQGRWGVTMERPYSILGQFWETAWCHNAQHGDGVCCALAPQLFHSLVLQHCTVYRYLVVLDDGSGTGGLRRNSSTTSFTTLPRLEWTTNCKQHNKENITIWWHSVV